jgi:hypothetical protein
MQVTVCNKALNCGAASKTINGFEVVLIEAGVVSGLFFLYRRGFHPKAVRLKANVETFVPDLKFRRAER